MKKKTLCTLLSLLLLLTLCACGKQPPASSSSPSAGPSSSGATPPEEAITLDTLRLELPLGEDPAKARAFAQALPEELRKYGVEVGTIELSFSPSPAATAQALTEGGVDLAFLPAEDFLRQGGGTAILADAEVWPAGAGALPGARAVLVTAPTDYGRQLAAREDPSWTEIRHARWGVLGQESLAGYRCLDLWLCDRYEDNGIADLPDVTEYADWDALLRAAAAGEIDALPLGCGIREAYAARWQQPADGQDGGFGRSADILTELPQLAETEGLVSQVAAVRQDEVLTSPAFSSALEAALAQLFPTDDARMTVLGAERFTALKDADLDPLRRSLLAWGIVG